MRSMKQPCLSLHRHGQNLPAGNIGDLAHGKQCSTRLTSLNLPTHTNCNVRVLSMITLGSDGEVTFTLCLSKGEELGCLDSFGGTEGWCIKLVVCGRVDSGVVGGTD